jgi:hypothetical protein
VGNDLSMEDIEGGDHVGVPGRFSSKPVHIGFGPFWFPGLPLAIIFVVALIFSSGSIRGLFALLAFASIGILILRTVILLDARHR